MACRQRLTVMCGCAWVRTQCWLTVTPDRWRRSRTTFSTDLHVGGESLGEHMAEAFLLYGDSRADMRMRAVVLKAKILIAEGEYILHAWIDMHGGQRMRLA